MVKCYMVKHIWFSKKPLLFSQRFGKIHTLLFSRRYKEEIMAKCSVCGKGAHFGIKVSHSHRRSNKMWKSNIKHVKCVVNGAHKRLYVCTACLRSGKVERA